MASQQYQVKPFVGQQPLERMAGTLAFLHRGATEFPMAKGRHSLDARTHRRMLAYQRLEALREEMAALTIEIGDLCTERDEAIQEKFGV